MCLNQMLLSGWRVHVSMLSDLPRSTASVLASWESTQQICSHLHENWTSVSGPWWMAGPASEVSDRIIRGQIKKCHAGGWTHHIYHSGSCDWAIFVTVRSFQIYDGREVVLIRCKKDMFVTSWKCDMCPWWTRAPLIVRGIIWCLCGGLIDARLQ